MDLILIVDINKDGSYQIYSNIQEKVELTNSVLTVSDYPYTPWPREGGNLLW